MKTVVLVSGGLDSYIAYQIAPEPKEAIWVDLGQPYAKKEEAVIDSFNFPVRKIKTKNLLPKVASIEDWIIPGRNLFLAMIGAMHGDRVWISALDGELHKFIYNKDKTPEFYHLASGLFTYIFDTDGKRPETIVETPFKTLSKTEAVALAIREGISVKDLINTSSCYHPKHRNCGECGTCVKRWIAMTNNNITEEYKHNPWESDYAKQLLLNVNEAIKNQDYTHYSKKRCRETLEAFDTIFGSF